MTVTVAGGTVPGMPNDTDDVVAHLSGPDAKALGLLVRFRVEKGKPIVEVVDDPDYAEPVAVALPKPQHKKGEVYHRTRYDGVKVWARHR